MKEAQKPLPVLVRVLALSLAFSLCLPVSGAWAGGPGEDVKSLINEVLTILNNPSLQGPSQRDRRVRLVEQAAARHFDYREMAKCCLGENWDGLNPRQQDEFVHLFTQLLKASYACRLDEITKARFTYQPEVVKGDLAEVPAVILRPNDKIPVTFRLRRAPQGWMIYDLVIETVSLAANYHAQFCRVIDGTSFQDLVRLLQQKLQEECKTSEPPKPASPASAAGVSR
jgi:phospholipid transport system substrate-binding protein